MAGHSKWANIKHKKAAVDAKKGQVFSKIAKEIMVAARIGGGDPGSNISLRALVQKARGVNMPADNIDRAIKKGTGEGLEGVVFEEIIYEGYAPGGVAVIAKVLTDNRNRTASEVRFTFTKAGASLGGTGSVMHGFQRKGMITVNRSEAEEEALMDIVLEAGAENLEQEGDQFLITTETADFMTVVDALNAASIPLTSSELTLIPDVEVSISDKGAATSLIRFVEALEDLDDVQDVYTNMDIPEDILAELEG